MNHITHEHKLVSSLQSLLARMSNDERTATMFEADGDTLRDAIDYIRKVAWRDRAALAQPESVELTDEQIKAGWEKTFSTNNPYCPCNLKSFTKAVKWAMAATKGGTV